MTLPLDRRSSAHAGSSSRRAPRPRRRGVAATELAVCLPILVIIAFASLELTYAIQTRQLLALVADETACKANDPIVTTGSLRRFARQRCREAGLSGAQVRVRENTNRQRATIQIDLPFYENYPGPAFTQWMPTITTQLTTFRGTKP